MNSVCQAQASKYVMITVARHFGSMTGADCMEWCLVGCFEEVTRRAGAKPVRYSSGGRLQLNVSRRGRKRSIRKV